MDKCEICGTKLEEDLFSYVTQEKVCSICKIKFIGGLPTTLGRINMVRKSLKLTEGEYLNQDNAEEAKQILGR